MKKYKNIPIMRTTLGMVAVFETSNAIPEIEEVFEIDGRNYIIKNAIETSGESGIHKRAYVVQYAN